MKRAKTRRKNHRRSLYEVGVNYAPVFGAAAAMISVIYLAIVSSNERGRIDDADWRLELRIAEHDIARMQARVEQTVDEFFGMHASLRKSSQEFMDQLAKSRQDSAMVEAGLNATREKMQGLMAAIDEIESRIQDPSDLAQSVARLQDLTEMLAREPHNLVAVTNSMSTLREDVESYFNATESGLGELKQRHALLSSNDTVLTEAVAELTSQLAKFVAALPTDGERFITVPILKLRLDTVEENLDKGRRDYENAIEFTTEIGRQIRWAVGTLALGLFAVVVPTVISLLRRSKETTGWEQTVSMTSKPSNEDTDRIEPLERATESSQPKPSLVPEADTSNHRTGKFRVTWDVVADGARDAWAGSKAEAVALIQGLSGDADVSNIRLWEGSPKYLAGLKEIQV